MRTIVTLALSIPLIVVPSVASAQTAAREVTFAEYRRVEPGMTRARVELIFGAGKGCEYTSYTIGDVLFTGRQYRRSNGATVSIRYRVREGRMDRVRAKQWNTVSVC